MTTNPGSAALTGGNPDPTAASGGSGGEQQDGGGRSGGEKPWFETAGVDAKFHDAIKAKEWRSPNDVLDSYTNVEKLVSLERGGDIDRIVVKPKADATPEEVAAFRAKAGFSAPDTADGYGFTPEQISAKATTLFAAQGLPPELAQHFTAEMAPVVGEAAKWFKEAGLPNDVAGNLVDQVLAREVEGLKAFHSKSDAEYTALGQELGDKFGDFEEAGRRAFKASGLDKGSLDKIEMAMGTKAMMQMFAKFGGAMTEAAAPQPGRGSGGQFTQSAEGAKTQIHKYQNDSDFQAKLLSPNPEVRKAATVEWENLFKTAYPPTA
jgi:hypothetical protein